LFRRYIASALFANGVRVFGHHPKDGSPQESSAPMDMLAMPGHCQWQAPKACMELVKPEQHIMPADGLPVLPKVEAIPAYNTHTQEIAIPVLIIGGARLAYRPRSSWGNWASTPS